MLQSSSLDSGWDIQDFQELQARRHSTLSHDQNKANIAIRESMASLVCKLKAPSETLCSLDHDATLCQS